MSAVMSSTYPVTLPRFAPSNTQNPPQSDVGALGPSFVAEGGGDPLDFDLLAEYLLDDSEAPTVDIQLPTFEFNFESNSGVVSPEQSEDGMPKQYETIAQVENIIAAQAVSQTQPTMQAIAPAPPGVPTRPHPGAPMPPAPAPSSFPGMAAPGTAPQAMMNHQHARAAPATKRRRTDIPSVSAASYMQSAPSGRGRQKTQAQIDRRRERNRILARRTRLRKKFFFESLQKEVIDLQKENSALKEIARTELEPSEAKTLLDGCKAIENLPDSIAEACGEGTEIDKQDFNLFKSIQTSQQSFIITDPSLQDNPIVYASEGFLSLTGYAREDVLGRNCRFLQGTETSSSKVEQLRKQIANGEDASVTMINYTADGTAFWNKLFVAALRDAQNNIVNFIGVIVKVASPDASDPEAGKRLPGDQTTTEANSGENENTFGDAEGMVKAIEGAVTQAVAAVPGMNGFSS